MKKLILHLSTILLLPGSLLAADVVSPKAPVLTANLFLDVARAGTRVVAVGDRGSILFSDDEGAYWRKADSPTGVLLTSVCFADSRHGWAVGHDAVVLGTTDGGATWQIQYSDVLAADTEDPAGEDYASDDYDDYDDYSEDYDDSAEEETAQDTSGAPLLDVVCLGKDRAVAVGGYGYLLETVDGGRNWSRAMDRLDNQNGWHLNGIAHVPGSSTLIAVGEKGLIFRSRDNGLSWKSLVSPYDGSFFGVTALRDGTVAAYGLQGNLWVSRNQGDTWRQVQTGVTRGINAAEQLPDDSLILVGGAGVVLISRDGGNSVVLQYLPDRESVSAVLPLAGGELVMVGDAGIRVKKDIR
jgi:photosystem II stability/assembly factor-like uncharacterized protein